MANTATYLNKLGPEVRVHINVQSFECKGYFLNYCDAQQKFLITLGGGGGGVG